MLNDEYGRRLRKARSKYEERHDRRLTLAEIGRRVAAVLGRVPYKHSAVAAWLDKGQEPESFAVAIALADVLEVDAGYLMSGRQPQPVYFAPEPPVSSPAETPPIARGAGERARKRRRSS